MDIIILSDNKDFIKMFKLEQEVCKEALKEQDITVTITNLPLQMFKADCIILPTDSVIDIYSDVTSCDKVTFSIYDSLPITVKEEINAGTHSCTHLDGEIEWLLTFNTSSELHTGKLSVLHTMQDILTYMRVGGYDSVIIPALGNTLPVAKQMISGIITQRQQGRYNKEQYDTLVDYFYVDASVINKAVTELHNYLSQFTPQYLRWDARETVLSYKGDPVMNLAVWCKVNKVKYQDFTIETLPFKLYYNDVEVY